jgi:hypothetical protein
VGANMDREHVSSIQRGREHSRLENMIYFYTSHIDLPLEYTDFDKLREDEMARAKTFLLLVAF